MLSTLFYTFFDEWQIKIFHFANIAFCCPRRLPKTFDIFFLSRLLSQSDSKIKLKTNCAHIKMAEFSHAWTQRARSCLLLNSREEKKNLKSIFLSRQWQQTEHELDVCANFSGFSEREMKKKIKISTRSLKMVVHKDSNFSLATSSSSKQGKTPGNRFSSSVSLCSLTLSHCSRFASLRVWKIPSVYGSLFSAHWMVWCWWKNMKIEKVFPNPFLVFLIPFSNIH